MLRTQLQVGAQRLQREAISLSPTISQSRRTEQIDVSLLRVVIVNFRLHNRVDTQPRVTRFCSVTALAAAV